VQVLADNGRFVLAEDGSRLLFIERRILPSWTVFVPGLLAFIVAANALLQLVAGNGVAAAVIAAVAVVSALVLRLALRRRRLARAKPLASADAVVQLDLAGRVLLDGDGRALAALDQVRIEKAMQMTSSARALTVVWPGNRRVVYRGDPLTRNGSIHVPAAVLAARGVPVAG
jgi:hypothetical protein